MFKKFMELFSSENLLNAAFRTTITMLESDREMYHAARKSLRESDTAELPFDIKKMDGEINRYEREVRRNVLTHLSVAGNANLVPGLILVSVVIDVERIGDYTKNIVDLAKYHPARLTAGSWEEDIRYIETVVGEQFDKIIPIVRDQDTATAREIMRVENKIGKKAESIVKEIIGGADSNMSASDAVTLALYVRHLKRINAHLTNIASSLVNPFPRIGFREKD
jgi:phosphate uptake regulator